MLKALMIVAATISSGEVRTTMNSMDECLEAKQMIIEFCCHRFFPKILGKSGIFPQKSKIFDFFSTNGPKS